MRTKKRCVQWCSIEDVAVGGGRCPLPFLTLLIISVAVVIIIIIIITILAMCCFLQNNLMFFAKSSWPVCLEFPTAQVCWAVETSWTGLFFHRITFFQQLQVSNLACSSRLWVKDTLCSLSQHLHFRNRANPKLGHMQKDSNTFYFIGFQIIKSWGPVARDFYLIQTLLRELQQFWKWTRLPAVDLNCIGFWIFSHGLQHNITLSETSETTAVAPKKSLLWPFWPFWSYGC